MSTEPIEPLEELDPGAPPWPTGGPGQPPGPILTADQPEPEIPVDSETKE